MNKIEELLENIKPDSINFEELKANNKLKALFAKKQAEEILEAEEEEKKIKLWVIILAVIGVIAIGCAIGYIIYRKNKPDYLEDFDDDFDDDDFYEDED